MRHTKRSRNRDILAANEAGETSETVAQRLRLATSTVWSIVTDERLKQAVSADTFYQTFIEIVAGCTSA
jgi:hypothetical protein